MSLRLPRLVVMIVDVACWYVGASMPRLPCRIVRAIEIYAAWTFRQRLDLLFENLAEARPGNDHGGDMA